MSCNDCLAIGWTDGYFIAMMWPDLPELVKCPHCKTFLWVQDQELIGELEGPHGRIDKRLRAKYRKEMGIVDQIVETKAGSAENPDFSSAEPYIRLNRWDYFKVLGQGGLDDERMRYIRVRAWHSGNHARRTSAQDPSLFKRKAGWTPPPMGARERANLEALLPLLDKGDDNDRLLKAEACRELGRFEEALRLLEGPPGEGLEGIAGFIRELAGKRDTIVREVAITNGQ